MTRALVLPFALLACATTSERARAHQSTVVETAPQRESTVEARRGGSYQNTITCGQQHRYTVDMGANESVRGIFRVSMTGAEPLGEDIAWRWLGPGGANLDTNALPIPEPNGAVRDATFEARATYAGRYTVVIAVESGAGCAHASYTLELR
jgi:hypothetical protein